MKVLDWRRLPFRAPVHDTVTLALIIKVYDLNDIPLFLVCLLIALNWLGWIGRKARENPIDPFVD